MQNCFNRIQQQQHILIITVYWLHTVFFQIFSEITHLPMCCHDQLPDWGIARHSHDHEQCQLSCTAGVVLNVRRSDRNANQVSKLTLHSHWCTSDLQWFISQSESMCHCAEWLMGKHSSHQGALLSSPSPLLSLKYEQHSLRGPLTAKLKNYLKTTATNKQVTYMQSISAGPLKY